MKLIKNKKGYTFFVTDLGGDKKVVIKDLANLRKTFAKFGISRSELTYALAEMKSMKHNCAHFGFMYKTFMFTELI